jgi:hypothetical protein
MIETGKSPGPAAILGLVALTLAGSVVLLIAREVNASRLQLAAAVQHVPSPFSRDGQAVLIKAPDDRAGGIIWTSDQVTPGQRYSLSFFFQNRTIQDPNNLQVLAVNVYDAGTPIHVQSLYPRNHPQFYRVDLEFQSSNAMVRLDVGKGYEAVVGEFGRALDVNELATTRFHNASELWSPDLRLPDVYRGLRRFRVGVSILGTPEAAETFGLQAVTVQARMNIAAAKLPRLLPGANELKMTYAKAGPGSQLHVSVSPRNGAETARFSVSYDRTIPADGATFGRVFVTAFGETKDLISGAFYRLRGPAEVKVFPYTKAISDWEKLQLVREFHLLSTHPGSYEMEVDVWNGEGWTPTGERFQVRFEPVDQAAPAFRRSDYPRRWIEPQAAGMAEAAARLSIPFREGEHEGGAKVTIRSRLAPTINWRIRGPIEHLGVYSSFQPDPRTLRTTAESLRRITGPGPDQEIDFALALEEYVNLFMEGVLPEPFSLQDYPSMGRIHREGRGWCSQYALALHALAVQGGLEAKLRNVPSHVTNEVRGKLLPPTTVDALLMVAVTDEEGNRTALDRADDDATRVLGAGVNSKSRRGIYCDFLKNPLPHGGRWDRRDSNSPTYLNAFLDEQILSVDLRAWEELTWTSGNVSRTAAGFSRGRRAENQNVLTKTSVVSFANLAPDAPIETHNLELSPLGLLTPKSSKPGRIYFPFECPVEVDDLFVSTEGPIGSGGQIGISLTPILETPLIDGQSWVKYY